MDENTKGLIDALQAVSGNAGPIANALMLNTMSPERQRKYADMLKELADLLYQHADAQEKDAKA